MSYGNKPNEIRHPQAALLADEYVCQRVQTLGYTGDLNSEEVNQLTDSNVVEVVDADPSVSITIDINDFGSINFLNQLAGNSDFPSHVASTGLATADNTNASDGTVLATTLSDVAVDFLVPIKNAEADTATARTLWFNNCFVDSISGTYQVDGFATESFAVSNANQRWFLNDWGGAVVGIPVYNAGTLDVTSADGSAVYLTEDGIKLSNTYWTQNASGNIIGASGYTFSSSSRYRYIWIPNTSVFPVLSDNASPVGGVKEGELEIIMWDNLTVTEPTPGVTGNPDYKLLRVQSVDYEVAYDREELKQLYTGTYYKGLNKINITATVTMNDSDLEMWAMTTGNYADWNQASSTVKEMALSDFQNMSNLNLRIDVFNTKDYLLHTTSTLLKSITLIDGKVTSVADSRDVPGRGTQTFELQFSSAYFKGTGLVGR